MHNAQGIKQLQWHYSVGIYERRNKWVCEHVNMSVYGTKAAATKLLEDWRSAQQEEAKQSRGQSIGSRVWQKPTMRWVKVNTDAAVIPGAY